MKDIRKYVLFSRRRKNKKIKTTSNFEEEEDFNTTSISDEITMNESNNNKTKVDNQNQNHFGKKRRKKKIIPTEKKSIFFIVPGFQKLARNKRIKGNKGWSSSAKKKTKTGNGTGNGVGVAKNLIQRNKKTFINSWKDYFCDLKIKCLDDDHDHHDDEKRKKNTPISSRQCFNFAKKQILKKAEIIQIPSRKYKNFPCVNEILKRVPKYIDIIFEIGEANKDTDIECSEFIKFKGRKNIIFRKSKHFKTIRDKEHENSRNNPKKIIKEKLPVLKLSKIQFSKCENVCFEGLFLRSNSVENPLILIFKRTCGRVVNCKIQGEVELRDCFNIKRPFEICKSEISDGMSVGLFIEGSYVKIRGNSIHSNQSNGINIGSSEGEISFNDIYENNDPGIFVKEGTDVNFSHNRIFSNFSNGINISNESTCLFEENEFWGNNDPALFVKRKSNPTIVNNIFRDSNSNAVNVDDACGYFEGNVFYNIEAPVIYCRNSTDEIIFHGNEIFDNPSNAIVLENVENARICYNTFSGTSEVAVYMQKSKAVCKGNSFYKNLGVGFYMTDKSKAVFENNVFEEDEGSPISLDCGSSAEIVENIMTGVVECNAILLENSEAKIYQNCISKLTFPAIYAAKSKVHIMGNVVKKCEDLSVYAYNSRGVIEKNDFRTKKKVALEGSKNEIKFIKSKCFGKRGRKNKKILKDNFVNCNNNNEKLKNYQSDEADDEDDDSKSKNEENNKEKNLNQGINSNLKFGKKM